MQQHYPAEGQPKSTQNNVAC